MAQIMLFEGFPKQSMSAAVHIQGPSLTLSKGLRNCRKERARSGLLPPPPLMSMCVAEQVDAQTSMSVSSAL